MLSGEGNAGERWKTTIGLISKKNNFARAAHFFVHFFAVVLHDYNRDFKIQRRGRQRERQKNNMFN